jgi:hypothetical protein
VIAYFLPIILGIRNQFDVEERETLLNWRVLNFCFALLQLVLKEEPAAKELDWTRRRRPTAVFLETSETLEKVMEYDLALLSRRRGSPRGLHGISLQPGRRALCGLFARLSVGDL